MKSGSDNKLWRKDVVAFMTGTVGDIHFIVHSISMIEVVGVGSGYRLNYGVKQAGSCQALFGVLNARIDRRERSW